MKKLLWIVNPNAGRGALSGKVLACVETFQRAGYEVAIRTTAGAQDATRIVREQAVGYDRIVCAGGDGTLNEVVTGLMALPADQRPTLGYIPAGTTNDFASGIALPKNDPVAAAAIAVGDALHALDVGSFGTRYFNYIAAFGLFTEVSYATPQQSKNVFGRVAYLMEGVKALTNIKQHRLRVQSAEQTIEDDFIYGMVSNTISVGGFKAIDSDSVRLDDGLYEVLLVYPFENPMELQWLINDLLTRNVESTRFAYFSTSQIAFESEESVPWTIDGEFGGAQTAVTIENNPRAITFATGF